jgi:uncharacterized protein YjbJ (UPF0337 family)
MARDHARVPMSLEVCDGLESSGRELEADQGQGNWKQIKGKVKEKWGDLTDDELDKIAGSRDQLEGKIQERYGLAKDQVRKDVDDWMNAQRW